MIISNRDIDTDHGQDQKDDKKGTSSGVGALGVCWYRPHLSHRWRNDLGSHLFGMVIS